MKGTLMAEAVKGVRKLRSQGRVSQEELEARLEAADLELLEEKIVPVLWYPVTSFGRLIELVWEVAGQRRREFLVGMGRRSAAALMQSGTYPALRARRKQWGDRVVQVMVSVTQSLYDFMTWEPVVLDDSHIQIRVSGAADWPDVMRFTTEGFIQQTSRGQSARVTSHRPTPDQVVFDVRLPPRPAGA